jgi:hypothetical protein
MRTRTPTARLSHHRFSTMRVVSGTLSASVEHPTQRNPQPRGTSHQPTWHNNKHLPTHQHQQQQQQQLKCRPRRRRRRLCLRSVGEAEVAGAPQSAVPRARLQLIAPSRWMVVERLRLETGACSRSTLRKMYVLPNPIRVLTKQQTLQTPLPLSSSFVFAPFCPPILSVLIYSHALTSTCIRAVCQLHHFLQPYGAPADPASLASTSTPHHAAGGSSSNGAPPPAKRKRLTAAERR